MELGLFQKQTTRLVMTNELRQAITILQYSTVELAGFIKEQALENPLIDLSSPSWGTRKSYQKTKSTKWQSEDGKNDPIAFAPAKEGGLHDYVLQQVQFLPLADSKLKILTYLIENLDEAGYLRIDEEEATSRFAIEKEDLEEKIAVLQSLEPVGIGARSLGECLYLQLKQRSMQNELAETIVLNDLKSLAERKYKELAKKYHVTVTDIQRTADFISTLDPKPGSLFARETTKYVIPDVTIKREQNGFRAYLNDELLPKISLNKQYSLLMGSQKNDAALYLKEKYQQYNWLLKSIQQRQETLGAILAVFIEKQNDFLEYGVKSLKPLTLREVAEEAGVHESTVSRAIKHKYVQTPHGLFELKNLFTSKIESNAGDAASSSSVKQRIKEMIDQENKQKPLSDQKIADILNGQKGIGISRRTVAKYRDEMKILSSSKRKRYN
ncbi:RNA polymerase factor sigma-54 [Pseudalkalibacillus caeni]|uniref:RNA polymerase factor sigma-54 n=1 Tax=Exobacillus caeni TaxID=2574798 RepID=A0A5R9EVS1_9BACL|nr:RNA polymerase factor sigma-54 [Pseudalkalibacillus caeni]TLS35322.1 RNA polymerase factor sigma-54 [Pseudalkalibacillus caeni]